METKKPTTRKPTLTASLITVRKGEATATAGVPARGADPKPEKSIRTEPLNFRVSAEFRRRFKIYAAAHDLSLSELLERAFDAFESSGR